MAALASWIFSGFIVRPAAPHDFFATCAHLSLDSRFRSRTMRRIAGWMQVLVVILPAAAGLAFGPMYGPPPVGLQHTATITSNAPCLCSQVDNFCVIEDANFLEELHTQLAERTSYSEGGSKQRMLRLALEVSYLAHLGQRRRSGEPYITHPVSVAAILADSRLDIESVVSGLLHDTVEDTELGFEHIERLFGVDVRRIVEGETKVSKLPKMVRSELAAQTQGMGLSDAELKRQVVSTVLSKQDEQVENLRSMFVAMGEHGETSTRMLHVTETCHGDMSRRHVTEKAWIGSGRIVSHRFASFRIVSHRFAAASWLGCCGVRWHAVIWSSLPPSVTDSFRSPLALRACMRLQPRIGG